MVSLDDPDKNRQFAESLDAELVLLSDTENQVGQAFGVVGFAGLYAKRWTFYVDREGIIRHIDKQVRVGSAGQDIAQRMGALGFPKKEEASAE